MKISSCSCSCGNIRVRGQLVPQGMYPNIPPTERERLRFCKTLFSIQPQSIDIQNFGRVKGRLLSPLCADMTCMSCGSIFRFFSCRGFSYMGKIQQVDNNNSQASKQNSNNRSFPPSKIAQKPIMRNQQVGPPFGNPPQFLNLNNNNENDGNLAAPPLPSLFTPLISRRKQKLPSQEINLRKEVDKTPSPDNFNGTPKTDLFSNIDDLELDNEIEIDRNLSSNRHNEGTLFTNNDDIDFELMFSNKADPVVGSYKQHMGAPIDGALGNISYSDFQPKSYFA